MLHQILSSEKHGYTEHNHIGDISYGYATNLYPHWVVINNETLEILSKEEDIVKVFRSAQYHDRLKTNRV